MDSSPPPDDPLARHFSGKRRWKRVSKSAHVRLQGASAVYGGRLLDVSPGGFHVAVEDPAFYQNEGDGYSLVHDAFPEGLTVEFDVPGLTRSAEVVRVAPYGENQISLGCRFHEELTESEAAVLDVAAAQVEEPEAELEALPWQARPQAPVSLLLFVAVDDVAGPRYVGRVVATGKRAVDAILFAGDESALTVARNLEQAPLFVALAHGRGRLWQGKVRLLSCSAAPGEPVMLRLLASTPLGRSVLRRMARTRASTTG